MKYTVRPFCTPQPNNVEWMDTTVPKHIRQHMAILEWAAREMKRCAWVPKDSK